MPTGGLRAVVLCAGEGTRLRPFSDSVPPPLIQVGGRPLLARIVEALTEAGVREVLVNLHHLPHQIADFLGDGSAFGVTARYFYEDELLGTAGALLPMRPFLEGPFFVIQGNLYFPGFPLSALPKLLAERGGDGVAVVKRPGDDDHARVETDQAGRITSLQPGSEAGAESQLSLAGIYFFRPRVLDFLRKKKGDLETDLLPASLRSGATWWALESPVNIVTVNTRDKLQLAAR